MERVNIIKGEINDSKKIQIELLEMRNAIFEIQNALNRINIRSYT